MGLDYNALKPHSLSSLVDARIGNPSADFNDVIAPIDFTDGDWALVSCVANSESSFTTSVNTRGPEKIFSSTDLVIGKTYKCEWSGQSDSVLVRLYNSDGGSTYGTSSVTGGEFNDSFIFTTVDQNLQIINSTIGTTTFTNLSITEWSGEELIPDPDVGFVVNDVSKWVAEGSNTVTQDGNAVKITYVDDDDGAKLHLDSTTTGTLFSNLIVGDKFKIVARAKIASGNCSFRFYTSGTMIEHSLSNTEYQTFIFDLTVDQLTPLPHFRLNAQSPNETVWIEILSVKKISGLVAAYNMIPNGDTLVDISGEGNDGTILTPAPMSTPDGLNFDGSSNIGNYSCIKLKDSSPIISTTEYTVCGRFRFNSNSTDQVIFTNYNNSGDNTIDSIGIGTSDRLSWNFTSAGTYKTGTNFTFENGEWYDFVLSSNGSRDSVLVYINGVLTAEQATSFYRSDTVGSSIGRRRGGNPVTFNDVISDLQIYNYPWSASQVADYHNSFAKQVKQRDDMSDYGVGSTIG